MAEDFMDITPKGVMDGKGSSGRTNTVFQESEWHQIKENPSRLTKEGVMKKIELWKESSNKHTVIKYETMLAQCSNFSESGKVKVNEFVDGKEVEVTKTVLARDEKGEPTWLA